MWAYGPSHCPESLVKLIQRAQGSSQALRPKGDHSRAQAAARAQAADRPRRPGTQPGLGFRLWLGG